MANSPLDFPSTQTFRQRLIVRNLAPYQKSPNRPTPPYNFEIIQSDYSVVDSPDQLIDNPTFANQLYPLNQYGSEGGYIQAIDPNRLLNTNSNEGEYGVQDAEIINDAFEAANGSNGWKRLNPYGSGNVSIIDSADNFSSLEILRLNQGRNTNNQPYPTTFVPSFYSPLSILLSNNPNGTNGPLSNDSFIVRLGASLLRKGFEDRIAREITRRTIGRANIFNANSGTDVLGLVTGTVPLIEPNYTITIPINPITAAAQFALSLGGSVSPTSLIPGSYFDPSINPGQPTTLQQIRNAYNTTIGSTGVGKFISALFGGGSKTGSEIFLENTGPGQKSRLFKNLDYNKYKPGYDRNVFDRVAGVLVGTNVNNSNYYIGSTNSEPSNILSPSGELPTNDSGQEIKTPVYGPQEIAQLYEGTEQVIKLGANGPTYSNGGGIEGGFTWVSPKYKNNAGFKVGPGGNIAIQDPDYKESSYISTESTNLDFKGGSILDDTQRIIDSQPQGGRRLQHVGNAIDQVSKVFNDGYKELTKGSRVLSYVGEVGQEKGAEYCRVFAKDTPYLQYNDLQKRDGITTEGRRFSYSVFDKTYNLNIVPNKMEGGQDSSNLIGGMGEGGHVKKYLFSLENLAWRTSNRPGFTVSDLPVCERGPNGGRIMWFPPYDLKFTDNSTANWKSTDLLGRPEPIYTYTNTTRGGTLSWKIVVDHPSVLNLVVNRVLSKETNKQRIDSILDSFFAGCKKYDLYELAKKYYTVNPNDLFEIQKELLANEPITTERVSYIKKELGEPPTIKEPTTSTVSVGKDFENKYGQKKYGVFFENDYPKVNGTLNYNDLYVSYTSPKNESDYARENSDTTSFFKNVIEKQYSLIKNEMIPELVKLLEDSQDTNGSINITINGSASAPQTIRYNKLLSQRRQKSLKELISNDPRLTKYVGSKLFVIESPTGDEGENSQVFMYDSKTNSFDEASQKLDCSDGDATPTNKDIYTTRAMACRRAYIGNISVNLQRTITEPPTQDPPKDPTYEKKVTTDTREVPPTEVTRTVFRDNITKRVLRQLLSECDYFEVIKEETPMVYDNLRDKLKFFDPAFHSTTPEGLNSRLTFLQQCLRPGDTIPIVKTLNGSDVLEYNNATNSAFGTPPVLVLRVGDFYHTKIIPESLTLSYENLDINPEGIGIQPMIANVSMNFKFVGGHGLAGAVDKLQNALSFNYYANTEIYDDRADVTDTSYQVLDKEFLDFFNITLPPPTTNDAKNVNNNGQSNNSTIGTVLTTQNSNDGETGTISYTDFVNKLVPEIQDYFINVFNKSKEVFKQYNNAVMQNWTSDRNYQNGYLLSKSTPPLVELFGKPYDIQTKFDSIVKSFKKDIDDENEGFIKFISNKNFSSKTIRTLKDNYKNYLDNKVVTIESAVIKITQDFVILQQNLIGNLGRANTIAYLGDTGKGTDGYQQKNGFVQVYFVNGQGLTEYINDINVIKNKFKEFNDIVKNPQGGGILIYDNESDASEINYKKEVFKPFSTTGTLSDDIPTRRSYMLLSDDIIDNIKYSKFKSAIIDNIKSNTAIIGSGNNELEKEFDSYWIGDYNNTNSAKKIFVEENSLTETFLNTMENKLKEGFFNFKPFPNKERIFDYTTIKDVTESNSLKNRQDLIKSLGLGNNKFKNKDTWNDGDLDSVLFSKIKFN